MAVELVFKDMTRPSQEILSRARIICEKDGCEECKECDRVGAVFESKAKKHTHTGMIRKAQERDIPALRDIYNYEVLNGVATFDSELKSLEDRKNWFMEHTDENHILHVAVVDGIVTGYASLSSYRPKDAFFSTVELSVYIDPMWRGRGIATALMSNMIYHAKQNPNIHNVVSVITSGNEASTRLHERFGFTFCGTMPEVGVKNGQLLGIDNYCLIV